MRSLPLVSSPVSCFLMNILLSFFTSVSLIKKLPPTWASWFDRVFFVCLILFIENFYHKSLKKYHFDQNFDLYRVLVDSILSLPSGIQIFKRREFNSIGMPLTLILRIVRMSH